MTATKDITIHALHKAVEKNDWKQLEKLLQNGADVDLFFTERFYPYTKSMLHVSCAKGHRECVKVLLAHGAKVNVRDERGQTPLMYCSMSDYTDITKMLLEACPEVVNYEDDYGMWPLHYAVEVGNLDVLSLFLKYGADVNAQDYVGNTPLIYSCFLPPGNRLSVMELLIHYGASVDLFDYKRQQNALHLASVNAKLDVVKILLAAGADINIPNATSHTPLTLAVSIACWHSRRDESYMEIIKYLVSAGADLTMCENENVNPLMVSALVKCPPLIEFFLEKGVDPNIKTPKGVTPALISTTVRDIEGLKVLIQHGCDFTIAGCVTDYHRVCTLNLDPFQKALFQNSIEICLLLVHCGYPVSRMWIAEQTQECLRLRFPNIKLYPPSRVQSLTLEELCDCSSLTMLSWIAMKAMKPVNLACASLIKVRQCLGQGRSIKVNDNIESLPLPRYLKDCVSLVHVFSLF